MDKIEAGLKAFWGGVTAFFSFLATPLEWVADLVRAYPKGALIVWVVSLVIAKVL